MDVGHELTSEQLKRMEKRLAKEYAKAEKEMRVKLKKHMDKFKAKDAEKAALVKAGKLEESEYLNWRMNQMLRSKWANDMIDDYVAGQAKANLRAASLINDSAKKAYCENFNYGTYQIERDLSLSTNFTLYNEKSVRNINARAKVNVTKDEAWHDKKVSSAITQGILQGESVDRIAGRMLGIGDMDFRAALRTARTTMTAAQNEGRLDSFERASDMGIEMQKTWIATLDDRVRESHAELDGETVPIDEPFSNGLMYPADPNGDPAEVYNCRCTMIAQLKGFERDVTDSGLRPAQIGSYDEWKREHTGKDNSLPAGGVVDGKNITDTWERRADKFDFEIEDVINAQGFDGLPQVVSADEFDAAVKESSFLSQRTYTAPSQEILDGYRDQLYNGKWYVDCGTGGAQYGQGMYCAADYTGKLTAGIAEEMKHYQMLGAERFGEIAQDDLAKIAKAQKDKANEILSQYKAGKISKERGMEMYKAVNSMSANEFLATYMKDSRIAGARSYTETITLHPSARIISYDDIFQMKASYPEKIRDKYKVAYLQEHASILGKDGIEFAKRNFGIDGYEFDWKRMNELYENMSDEAKQIANAVSQVNAPDEEVFKYNNMDLGAFAVLNGYDAINAMGHGASSSYTVILNRTKCIIKRG